MYYHYFQGYSLIEFEKYTEAIEAVKSLNGFSLLGNKICVDFAFVKSSCRLVHSCQLHAYCIVKGTNVHK